MLEWVAISSSFATLLTIAHQAPSVFGIIQARILEWVAISSSRESSQPRNRTQSPAFRQMIYLLSHQGTPEYIMQNAKLEEAQAGIKISGRNINNLRYADDTTLMAESERGSKKPLNESERREEKSWLKAQHIENEDHGIWSNRWGNGK